MYVAESSPDYKRETRILGDWTGQGPLEGDSKHYKLTDQVRHHVPRFAVPVQVSLRDGDR